MPTPYETTATGNAGIRNRVKSTSGSRRWRWRRRNTHPSRHPPRGGLRIIRKALLGQRFDCIYQREDRCQRQNRARRVGGPGVDVTELRQDPRPEHEQRDHHRQVDEKHRSPPEELQHDPADGRSGDPAERETGDPDPDGGTALLCMGNIVRISDSVEGASVAAATPRTARAAINISALVEYAAAVEVQPNATAPISNSAPTADAVAETAHRDQTSREHESVDVDDPQQFGAAWLEVRAREWEAQGAAR